MSHFIVLVLLKDVVPDAFEINNRVEAVLAPFDENEEVEPYEDKCWCVGHAAIIQAREAAERQVGSIDSIRDKFNANPDTAELRRKGNEWSTPEKLGITKEEHEAACADVHKLWREALKPYEDAEAAALAGIEDVPVSDENEHTKGNILPVSELKENKIPFAIVTPDGEWAEKGKMGWWACVSDEKKDWPEQARAILEKHKDCLAVAVDCHI